MNRKMTAIALAVGATLAAPAFADVVEVYTIPSGRDVYYTAPSATYVPAPGGNYYYVPESRYYYTEPAITVEAPRYYNDDQRITADVVDAIAADGRIRGNIGVSTYRNNVELSGRVTTPGQRDLAGRAAKSVDGVNEVQNLIKPRVGDYF